MTSYPNRILTHCYYKTHPQVCSCGGGKSFLESESYGQIYCWCFFKRFLHQMESDAAVWNLMAPKCSFDTFVAFNQKAKFVLDTVKATLDRPKWLMLSGHYGTGKTHLLSALYWYYYPLSAYVSGASLEDLVHQHRKTDTLTQLSTYLGQVPYLVIDDIGLEYGGDLVKATIDKIVDKRYRNPDILITSFGTNLNSEQLVKHVPRAADRMMDVSLVTWIPMLWTSYRANPRGKGQ